MDSNAGDMTLADATAPARRRRRRPASATARPANRGATVSGTIYRDLRDDIVSLRRKPGEPLIEKEVADTYGVSRTPVREAMLKLADEGLVEVFPQSGTFVARIPLSALPEAIAIRRALEEATVRYAAEQATGSQVARLRANLELQREMEEAGNFDGFHEADEEFHALLAEISGYPGFWTVTQQVKRQVDRYRHLTLPVAGRMKKALAEHGAVVEAIAARDPDRAVAELRRHLTDLQLGIADVQRTNPHYFTN
ncbi:GntR family transcriptional regulator (plasmid) [Azospirillum humicireducens]|uniref:GntR family transcriptional regulator n=1 Tax=Azospirillum humicireducens TaxID=1226968 RepID=A0A2R4VV02_9PROT|nr:GntR family transcriptional regulator [Azospirillum humicireducens]AWB08269.1 GntR family transcriptional regulator [Azospirillum humicireducens]